MANVKIDDLVAITDPASTDVLPIVDLLADVTKKVSIENILKNAANGTAAAPSLTFDTDQTTGIFLESVSELGFSTNGVGRLYIDENGNVGIGTATPTQTLDVVGTGSFSAGPLTVGGFNVVTVGDTGTVTSTMIADGTIVDADVNASAAIGLSKLATGALPTGITVASANIVDGTIVDADVNASAAIGLSKLATGALPTGITVASANIVDGTIVDADVSATAEIAVSKLANGTARQLLQTDAAGTGVEFTSNVDVPGTLDVTGVAVFDNNVGIGTNSPAAVLHLNSSGSACSQVISCGTNTGTSNIYFGDSDGFFRSSISYLHTDDALTFSANGISNEGMRIDSDGNVGIGTSNPQSLLSVQDNLQSPPTSTWNTGSQFTVGDAANQLAFGRSNVSPFPLWMQGRASNNATRSILINPVGGNVGIGTSSPAQELEVSGTAPRIRITDNDTAAASGSSSFLEFYGSDARAGIIYTDATGLNIWADSTGGGNLALRTETSEKMRIDSNGNVGIGTSSPTGKLEIAGNSSSQEIRYGDGTTTGYFISITDVVRPAADQLIHQHDFRWNGTSVAQIKALTGDDIINKDNGYLTFETNNGAGLNERMRIDGNGNVGIGTSSPGEKLEVNGTIKATDINFTGLATYADDTAAGTGGLVAGDVYKTSTGELRIKL